MYSNSEKVDMLLMLGKCDRNAQNIYMLQNIQRDASHNKMPVYNIEKCVRVHDSNKIIFDINVSVE